ncbi:MAG: ribosomal protein methyltransferase [Actinomycetota bacterium]|jgi:ribosomal protein L11 methyltransferase
MRQLVVTVPLDEVELASDALWAMGVVAVEERAVETTSLVELWTSLESDVVPDLAWPCRFEEVDEAVGDTWRLHAAPTWITDQLVVCPAWAPREFPAGVTRVLIEPGPTFGMGDHPTTRLTLAAASRLLSPGSSVLDVGCGSGVLAIGCRVLGASRAVGVDISPSAVPVTTANAALNGVDVEVSTMPLAAVEGQFDLVLANILAPALLELASDLRRVMAPMGRLVVSGLLSSRHEHVVAALAPLAVEHADHLDGWCALTLRHLECHEP